MSTFKIFLSSPRELDAERAAVQETVSEVSEIGGEQHSGVFVLEGSEQETPGIRRPLERLGDRLRKCDYLLLILGARWGSPTGPDGTGYSSGTEEEYEIAWECLRGDYPMRDIAVLFKGIPEPQLIDPGPQLQRVLDFKARLEREKRLLYATFDSEVELRRLLRRHLFRWLRDEDEPSWRSPSGFSGDGVVSIAPELSVGSSYATLDSLVDSLLRNAQELAGSGRTSEAEALYAEAISRSDDLKAPYLYARFLRKHNNRLAHSIDLSRKMIATAEERGEVRWKVLGLGNLGVCQRRLGKVDEARATLNEAVQLAKGDGEDRAALAYLENNLGLTLRRGGDIEQAEVHYRKALHLYEEIEDRNGKAHAHVNLSFVIREQGDLASARVQAEAVVSLGAGDPNCVAMAHCNLGLIAEEEDDLPVAERCFEKAREINSEAGDVRGQAMNFAHLARVKLEGGDDEGALLSAGHALALNEWSSNTEGTAMSLQVIGRIQMSRERYKVAESQLNDARDIYKALGHRIELARTCADLAILLARTGQVEDARRELEVAGEQAAGIAHVKLQVQLTRAEHEVAAAERELPDANAA